MKVTFTATPNIDSIKLIARGINNKIINASNGIITDVLIGLSSIRQIDKFVNFLYKDQFRADFGISSDDGKELANDFQAVWLGQNTKNHSGVNVSSNSISFNILNEDYLRRITFNLWDNTFKKDGSRKIIVNAWDIYEYGVVGSKRSNGVIPGFVSKKAVGRIQRIISRSQLSLMIPSASSFRFQTGDAPRINSIRSSILKNDRFVTNKIVKSIKRVLEV